MPYGLTMGQYIGCAVGFLIGAYAGAYAVRLKYDPLEVKLEAKYMNEFIYSLHNSLYPF